MLRLIKNDEPSLLAADSAPSAPAVVVPVKDSEPSQLERTMRDDYLKKKKRQEELRLTNNHFVTGQYRLKKPSSSNDRRPTR